MIVVREDNFIKGDLINSTFVNVFFKTKCNANFAFKLAQRSNRSFSAYLMNHLFQTSVLYSLICDNGMHKT